MALTPVTISIIVGSTRPNRFSEKPAKWIFEEAKKLEGVNAQLLDLRDYPMPFFDLPTSPSQIKDGKYPNDIVNTWAGKVRETDAFIIVTPEYNHGYPAVLKNALDSVYYEWNNKAVGFVSYGSVGGGRVVEQLREVAVELQMAPIRLSVHIPGSVAFPIIAGQAQWNADTEAGLKGGADTMLSQLVWWAKALKAAREQGK